jgi:hypothetical protein
MATTSKDQKPAWKAREAKRVEELRLAKAWGFTPPIKPRISAAECPHCINQDGVVHDHRLPSEPDTPDEGTVGFLDHVDVLIAGAFSAEGEKVLFADEAVELKRAGERLRPAFDELMRVFVEPVRKSKPSVADYGREKLVSLMVDAFIVGGRATLSKSAEKLARWRSCSGRAQRRRKKPGRATTKNCGSCKRNSQKDDRYGRVLCHK